MARARLIDIEDAKLTTLTVEIKALTVSGKQMTLSTFRQLPEASIWANYPQNLALRGVPWGRVRYFWGDQPRSGWHLVWQDESELFRCHLTPKPQPAWPGQSVRDTVAEALGAMTKTDAAATVRDMTHTMHQADAHLAFARAEHARAVADPASQFLRYMETLGLRVTALRSNNHVPVIRLSPAGLIPPELKEWVRDSKGALLRRLSDAPSEETARLENLRQECVRAEARLASAKKGHRDVYAQIDEDEHRITACLAAYTQAIATLSALPQLFIAL